MTRGVSPVSIVPLRPGELDEVPVCEGEQSREPVPVRHP